MNQPTSKTAEAMFKRLSIGERIRYLLEVREVGGKELARRIGISQSAVSNLVTDASRKPSAPTLLLIANELGVNPQWILDGEGDPFAWAPVTQASQVELLKLFHGMSPEAKEALLATARAMKQGPKPEKPPK